MTNPLTPDEVNALQGRELDAAVAEWMGWRWVEVESVSSIIPPGYKYGWMANANPSDSRAPRSGDWDVIGRLPYYSTDISAMYEVENEIHNRGLTEPYIEALSQVIAPEYFSIFTSAIELDRHALEIDGHEFMWRMAHATPEQRARAVVLMAQEIAAQDRLMHQMSDHAMVAAGDT